jgi:heat shock protein HslJ
LAVAVTFGAALWFRGTPPLDQEYIAVSLDGRPSSDKSRILKFSRDAGGGYNLYAHAGCNHFGSRIHLLPFNLVIIEGSFMTAMYCPGKMEIEKQYFDTFQRMLHWRINGERLILLSLKNAMHLEPRRTGL